MPIRLIIASLTVVRPYRPRPETRITLRIREPTFAAAPIVASYPYYCSRPEHSVPAIVTFFPSCLECGGTVSAQAACLLPGAPNFASQAHSRRPDGHELSFARPLRPPKI